MAIRIIAFQCRGKNADEYLFDRYHDIHTPILVVRVLSYYPSIRMHPWVQDTLRAILQKARAAKTWMGLSAASIKEQRQFVKGLRSEQFSITAMSHVCTLNFFQLLYICWLFIGSLYQCLDL